MEISNYAPVIIPTLNRYEHFKRCLESLEQCSGAEHTDVYVALDFPPSEKYVDGWKKIDSYLKEKEQHNGFKSIIVYRRDHNLGICNPTSNFITLENAVREVSDKYIFTEDDNVFSPNFLEYVNWGLETFDADDSIMFICGFKRVNVDFLTNNVYKYPKFAPWGYGTWAHKRDKYRHQRDFDYIKEYLKSISFTDLFTDRIRVASILLGMLKKRQLQGDGLTNMIPIEKRNSIFPKKSMVRNLGWDGSGQHGGSKSGFEYYKSLEIDDNIHFVPIITEELYDKRLKKVYESSYKTPLLHILYNNVRFVIYKLTGKII